MVVTIMGVVAAIAMPRFSGAQTRYRVMSAAHRIVTDLELARQKALTTSKTQTLEWKPGSGFYVISNEKGLDRPGTTTHSVKLGDEPYRVSVTTWNFGGNQIVSFDPYGVPDSDGEIIISVKGYSRRILLDPVSGRADIQP
ncbi:MAG: GspH/FimT family pseudopilin [Phycisphaerales bacterium]|nr:GspH/FimT family pseudopilin [Phycisphaerales bacterium]